MPCAPILRIDEVAADAQAAATGMIAEGADPAEGYRTILLPLEWDGQRAAEYARPPRAGQHTREILEELGYDDDVERTN